MNTNGIGLGLVIADQIVNKFNGTISFESQHLKGSKFTFTFLLDQTKPERSDASFLS